MSTTFVTLPRELVLDGIVHVQHWRTHNHVIMQNYSSPVEHDGEFLGRANQIAGQNYFNVYRVDLHNPGESLGDKVATFSHVEAAMTWIARAEQP